MASHAAAAASPHPVVQSSTINQIASGQVAATVAAKVPPPVLTTSTVGTTAPMMIAPNIKATSAVDAVGVSTVTASTVTASTVGASTVAHLVSHEEQGPVTKKSKLN